MLRFGSKKKKTAEKPVVIHASPSLPELAQQRIPWPADLVDVAAVHASNDVPPGPQEEGAPHGARKTSFHTARGPVPFHRPFRAGETSLPGSPQPPAAGGTPPPSAFNNGVSSRTRAGSYRSTRRAKHAPTFNVMVAGAKQTGKSSLLRLLLDTSAISPANTQDQLSSLAAFRASAGRPTTDITVACVEIVQGPVGRAPGPEDRISLTCIDTPGLDFAEGKEFALDRAVSAVAKYVDLQFAETMGEESKVVRTSKDDQHVHLCIYLIDPDSVMTPSARRARSRLAAATFPAQPLPASDLPQPSEYDSGSEDEDGDGPVPAPSTVDTSRDSDDEYGEPDPAPASTQAVTPSEQTPRTSVEHASRATSPPQNGTAAPNRLCMSPAEVRVIARLAKRVNVLPVIARADTLTDGRLARVQRAVRRDLAADGGPGVFAVWDADTEHKGGGGGGGGVPNGRTTASPEPEEERASRPVIRLRERARGLVRSRSRKSLRTVVSAEYGEPEQEAAPGYALSPPSTVHGGGDGASSRRTSVASAGAAGTGVAAAAAYGGMFSRTELRARMPFAVIAPERARKTGSGQFVRRFRWGTIDVLDPQHCDFAALRAAVLGSYMRALKATTKDVLYERFRTEKLLARRATANISESERKRIMQDLGL